MGPTRKRELLGGVIGAALVTLVLMGALYRSFPPITLWTGVSLLCVAVAEGVWGRYVRAKIADNQIGDGNGRLHPLAVARSVTIAKASSWVGALVLGWWLGVLVFLLPKDTEVADRDIPGAALAAVYAFALIIAGVWLQYCCRKPDEPPDVGATANE